MTPPKIVFVNRFGWPEPPATAQLLTDLSERLAAAGESVTVISRRPPGGLLRQQRNSVDLLRLPGTYFGRTSLLGRAVDFVVFRSRARRALRTTLARSDILVSMTDPPLLGVGIDSIAQAAGAHHVHWIQDVFPEVATAVSGHSFAQVFARGRDRAWQRAAACVAPGQDMAAFVRSRGVPGDRVIVAENWAPAGLQAVDPSAWRRQHGLHGKFVVMYSGNLGRVHDFSSIVPLAQLLASDSRILLLFVGGGARRPLLEKQVKARGLTNVRFLPAQPRELLSETLSAADVHLITLRAGCERYVFPSKLYGIAAVGRRVLVLGPRGNEAERIARHFGFGTGYTPGETERIGSYLREAATDHQAGIRLGRAALEFSRARGQLHHALAIWSELFARLKSLAGSADQNPESEAD